MKKRILILAVLLAVFTSSAFAVSINVKGNEYKSSPSTSRVGLGLQVGYPLLDAVITYTNTNPQDDLFGFRFSGSFGFNFAGVFNINATADWIFYQLYFTNTNSKEAENSILDFSLGAGVALGFGTIGYIGPIGSFAVNYTFAKNWVVFLRTNLGYVFGIYGASSNMFYVSGTAGFTYEFDV